MDLDDFCYVQRIIRARCISQSFQQVSPLMRSTLLQPASFQLALTVLLAIVPFISATPSRRQQPPTIVQISGNFEFQGCYGGQPASSLQVSVGGPGSNSVENCLGACKAAGLSAAGLEGGTECFCAGDVGPLESGGAIGSEQCNVLGLLSACPANPADACGGRNTILVYKSH